MGIKDHKFEGRNVLNLFIAQNILMKGFSFILILSSLIILACEKDKFETKPELEIKNVNSKNLRQGQDLVVNLEFRDKEGDVDSILYVVRERINRLGKRTVTNNYAVPNFPNQKSGEIQVTLGYANRLTQGFSTISLPGNQVQPDTMNIKFILKDRKDNLSDTVVVDNVIIAR